MQMILPFFVKDAQSLRRILNLMKKFQEFSSSTTNVEKCEASWIGRANQSNAWDASLGEKQNIAGSCTCALAYMKVNGK